VHFLRLKTHLPTCYVSSRFLFCIVHCKLYPWQCRHLHLQRPIQRDRLQFFTQCFDHVRRTVQRWTVRCSYQRLHPGPDDGTWFRTGRNQLFSAISDGRTQSRQHVLRDYYFAVLASLNELKCDEMEGIYSVWKLMFTTTYSYTLKNQKYTLGRMKLIWIESTKLGQYQINQFWEQPRWIQIMEEKIWKDVFLTS